MPVQPNTEIQYTLEPADYQHYYRYLYSRQLPPWAQVALPVGLLLPTVYIIAIGRNPLDYPIVAMCLIGFVLYWWTRRVALRAPAQPQTSSHRLLRLTPAGVQQSIDTETETVLWLDILKIVQTKEYLYLFESANTAFVVPIRAFPNPQAAAAFYQQALALQEAYMEHPYSADSVSAQAASKGDSQTDSAGDDVPPGNNPDKP